MSVAVVTDSAAALPADVVARLGDERGRLRGEDELDPAVGEAGGDVADLAIGARGAEVVRPVYLPGYVAWEHALGHHDPLTDVFSSEAISDSRCP